LLIFVVCMGVFTVRLLQFGRRSGFGRWVRLMGLKITRWGRLLGREWTVRKSRL
jgi:hypothetical protein